MRSRPSSRRRSIRRPASFASRPFLRIRPANGFPRNGRYARSSDIASAQRMGAALTYARRYALFTLVGIAGEDDLDAPDLGADPNPAAELPRPPDHRKQSNGQAAAAQRTAAGDGKLPGPSARSVLGEQLSASLRESLIEQMAAINSEDEAAAWAHRNLPAKNTLTAADAKIVEERFQARLSTISNGVAPAEISDGLTPPQALRVATPGQSDAVAEKQTGPDAGPSHKGSTRAKKQSRTLRSGGPYPLLAISGEQGSAKTVLSKLPIF